MIEFKEEERQPCEACDFTGTAGADGLCNWDSPVHRSGTREQKLWAKERRKRER